MMSWLQSLEARERLFVVAGAVIVTCSLLYGFVWVPLDSGYKERVQSVENWQSSVNALAALSAKVAGGNTTGANRTRTNQTPVVVIDQTLRQRELHVSLRRSQPVSSTGIRVEFENVAFDELVLWLGDISANHSMHVQAASFSTPPRAAPGRVNATLTLERAP